MALISCHRKLTNCWYSYVHTTVVKPVHTLIIIPFLMANFLFLEARTKTYDF